MERKPIRTIETSFDLRELCSEERRNEACKAMFHYALEIGVSKGVGFICIQSGVLTFPVITFTAIQGHIDRDPSPLNQSDRGTNYFGIAMGKLATMLATRQESDHVTRFPKRGEVYLKGGVLTQLLGPGPITMIYSGFSGGTGVQDLEIAQMGMETMLKDVKEDPLLGSSS
jgi:hypothetical protein